MSLIYLNDLITELQTVEIRSVTKGNKKPQISLDHYDQPMYERRMRRMERSAITDLSTLEKTQYNFAINRLDSIRNSIEECRDEIWGKLLFNRRDTPIDVKQIAAVLADYNIDTLFNDNISYDTNRGQFESDFIVPFIMILYEWEDTIISIRRQLLDLNVWTEWIDFF